MPNKNVPVKGNVSGAGFTPPSASSSFNGSISTPQMPNAKTWPVDTGMPPGVSSNSQVSSSGAFSPALLGFGSSLLGAGLGFLFNKLNYDDQLDEQLRREEFQKEWRDNERLYNLPAAQVDRLNDAGLNGKLILSQQGLSQGQTSPQNGNVSPSFDATGPAAMLAQGGATAANMLLQQKLMQAQVDNIEAQTNKTHAETMLLPEQLRGMRTTNDTYSATQNDIIKQTRLQSVKQLAENRLMDANARIQEIQADVIERFGHRNAEWSFKILDQQYQQIKEEILNLQKQGKNIDADTLVKKVEKRLKEAQINESNARTKNINRITGTIPIFNDGQARALAAFSVTSAYLQTQFQQAQIKHLGSVTAGLDFDNASHPYNPANYIPVVSEVERFLYKMNKYYPTDIFVTGMKAMPMFAP